MYLGRQFLQGIPSREFDINKDGTKIFRNATSTRRMGFCDTRDEEIL